MIQSLTLTLCVWVTASEPVPFPAEGSDVGAVENAPAVPFETTPAPAPHGYLTSGFYGNAGGIAPAVSYGPYAYDNCNNYGDRGRCYFGPGTCCCDFWCPPCTMTQRLEYWPAEHGYYYFRPYNMMHVRDQREVARSWGEDPRNPYDHKVFDRVYDSLKTERTSKTEGASFEVGTAHIESTSRAGKSALKPASFVLPQSTRFRIGHQPIEAPDLLATKRSQSRAD
jgi:hypothetical protein